MALTPEQKIIRLHAMYAINPIAWVEDRFEGRFQMTVQHRQFFMELGNLIKAKLRAAIEKGLIADPDYIAVVGNKVTEEDRPYLSKIGLSIASGRGVGKTGAAAIAVWFFMDVFTYPVVMVTAPNSNTLSDVLWRQVSKWRRLSNKINPKDERNPITHLENVFELQSDKIFHKKYGEKGKEWSAVARTIPQNANPESQAETLSGRHEKFMLFVIDEATGVGDPVFKPLEGSLTGIVNIAILIFNHTRTRGYAHRSQFEDSQRWVTLRWNAEESPLVDEKSIQILADKYGKDSNPYRISVLGLPPKAESDALIPPDWLADAVDRQIEPMLGDPLIKSLDCGAGGDKSVICTRKGGMVYPFKRNSTKDSNMLVGWVKSEIIDSEADALVGDSIGIGWHVMGEVRRELGSFKVRNFDSRGRAFNEDRFVNRRAEAYWSLRKVFENGSISIPNDSALIDQLSVIKYDNKEDPKGRIKIIKKSEIKKLMTESGSSPDEADALAMSYAFDDKQFRKFPETEQDKYRKRRRDLYGGDSEHSFMRV